MVPASLYCLYNNLSFENLSIFDPTTYFIFMQIRLLMTGVIYQVDILGGKTRETERQTEANRQSQNRLKNRDKEIQI